MLKDLNYGDLRHLQDEKCSVQVWKKKKKKKRFLQIKVKKKNQRVLKELKKENLNPASNLHFSDHTKNKLSD